MEDVIARMQDEKNGIPIRTVKSFLSKIPSVFSGKSQSEFDIIWSSLQLYVMYSNDQYLTECYVKCCDTVTWCGGDIDCPFSTLIIENV